MLNKPNFRTILTLLVWYAFAGFFGSESNAGVLGDRLILSVNNVPYSQLQIEGYLNVKETLREDLDKSQVVAAANWPVALAAFMKDMSLYQEAAKSSGFRPQRDGVQKSLERVKTSLSKSERFQTRFRQLGIDDEAMKEHLARILTVENLRRSRQGFDKDKPNPSAWEDDLQKTAIIRWFDGGKAYEEIHPVP